MIAHGNPKALTTSSELLEMLETARHHKVTPAEIEAQRRSWVIGELMLDDLTLTREAAEALYDEATAATSLHPLIAAAKQAQQLLTELVRPAASGQLPVLSFFTRAVDIELALRNALAGAAAASDPTEQPAKETVGKTFASRFFDQGIKLPLTLPPGEIGEIADASGDNVLQVDPVGVRTDEKVAAIAALFVEVINLSAEEIMEGQAIG